MDPTLKYCYAYPRPAVTTDCVVFSYFDSRLHVLLIQRGAAPFTGEWAFPGGFLNMDECALEGAQRELLEETGMKDVALSQLHTFSSVSRDPRGRTISIVFLGMVNAARDAVVAGDDARAVQWFPVGQLPKLAFDHESIFQLAFRNLRFQMRINPVFYLWLPDFFTMEDVFRIYCSIMDDVVDIKLLEFELLSSGLFQYQTDGLYLIFDKKQYLSLPERDIWFCIH